MAGNYDDAPSRRMALDADGTVGYFVASGFQTAITVFSAAEMATLNNEDESYWNPGNGTKYVGYLFPEDRELDGVFYALYWNGVQGTQVPGPLESTADSTTGIDGTWTQRAADLPDYNVVNVNFRDNITSLATAGASGARVLCSGLYGSAYQEGTRARAFHLYGIISPGATPDRILFLDTANSDAVFSKPIDYAEVPRGQTQQRTIKLKNNSATKTINTLQLTAEDLYLNAGGWYTFSLDDVSYQATLNTIGNLGPGATKLIYVKQVVPDAETLGIQTGRLKVSHASLT